MKIGADFMFNIQCAFIIREQRAFFEQKVWIYRRNERLALPLVSLQGI